jgi:hypothetical protein
MGIFSVALFGQWFEPEFNRNLRWPIGKGQRLESELTIGFIEFESFEPIVTGDTIKLSFLGDGA